jgi:glutathione synthase/RimK-type ligase-like ATP-grasp enzyme
VKRVAVVTATSVREPHPDDLLFAQALLARGCETHLAAWDDPDVAWSAFDAAVLRSAWNYHLHVAAFASWLAAVDRAGVALVNPLATVQWNLHKRYLLELMSAGVPVVETALVQASDLRQRLAAGPWDEIVVKPAISASAYHTYRVRRGERLPDELAAEVRDLSDWVVQPFVRSVAEHGERSAVCIDGRVSHVVRKIARGGDFRVQSDFGGSVVDEPLRADDERFLENVLGALPVRWTYARVDWANDPEPYVMEVELIEPELFLSREIPSAARLADAVLRELGSRMSR